MKMKNVFNNKYRIVTSNFVFFSDITMFQVEIKRWYFPVWLPAKQLGIVNIHKSFTDAKTYINKHKKGKFVVADVPD